MIVFCVCVLCLCFVCVLCLCFVFVFCVCVLCHQELLATTFWQPFHLLMQPETERRRFDPLVLPVVHFQKKIDQTQHLVTRSFAFSFPKSAVESRLPFVWEASFQMPSWKQTDDDWKKRLH